MSPGSVARRNLPLLVQTYARDTGKSSEINMPIMVGGRQWGLFASAADQPGLLEG